MKKGRCFLVILAVLSCFSFAFGGLADEPVITHSQEYSSRAWTNGTAVPSARYGAAAATADCFDFYLIGGYDGSTLNQTLLYDTSAGTWTTMAPMPTGRDNIMAYFNPYNGLIYVPGGYNPSTGSTLNVLEAYDTLSDTWTVLAPLPVAQSGSNGGIVGNQLVIFGGSTTVTQIYDIATDTWSSGTSIPATAHSYGGDITYGNYIYVMGGWDQTHFFRYDPATDTWQAGPSLNSARNSPAAAVTSTGIIYVWGGGDQWNPIYDGEYYDLANWPGGSWTTISDPLPTGQMRGAYSCADDYLWFIGGWDGSAATNANRFWDGLSDCQCVPLAVELLSFKAQFTHKSVELIWETASEIDTLGFNLFRQTVLPDGTYSRAQKVNAEVIPSKGDAISGATYTFNDLEIANTMTYRYQLSEVTLTGKNNSLAYAEVTVNKRISLDISN